MFKVIIRNEYEKECPYVIECDEPGYDRTKFGDGAVHDCNSLKELYELWTEAIKLELTGCFSEWRFADVCIVPFEDHIEIVICEDR